MKRIILLVLATVIALGVFVGCEEGLRPIEYTEQESSALQSEAIENLSPKVLENINEGMTFCQIISTMGKPHHTQSVDHMAIAEPYAYEWHFSDGSKAVIYLFAVESSSDYRERLASEGYDVPPKNSSFSEHNEISVILRNKWTLAKVAKAAQYIPQNGSPHTIFESSEDIPLTY